MPSLRSSLILPDVWVAPGPGGFDFTIISGDRTEVRDLEGVAYDHVTVVLAAGERVEVVAQRDGYLDLMCSGALIGHVSRLVLEAHAPELLTG